MSNPVQKILIVGGGTAGWMTAAALSRFAKAGLIEITLIESEEIGTIGVGEATIPTIQTFNQLLGIDEADFMANTQATFKLGIEFSNWGKLGDSYIHPFGEYGLPIDSIPFYQFWLKRQLQGDTQPLDTWSLPCMAAKHRSFYLPSKDPGTILSTMNYAYQFDAGLFAKYLRNYAEARGVKRIEGRILDAELDADSGHVQKVIVENQTSVKADLFIDCSGFSGLLIEKKLKTGFEDWSHYLPCDRAVTIACERSEPLLPYTRATAQSAGWQWRIPLQHRIGNGHVYCSQHISDDEATSSLLENLDGEPIGDPRLIRFKTGRRNKFWNKNVVAIGLSGGFMEPLESTSIHLIQTGISKLIALLPSNNWSPIIEEEYNRLTAREYARVRDFIILHYKATQRKDTPFWCQVGEMDVPETLTRKIELFLQNGRFFREEDELFTDTSWIAVLIGQNIIPKGYDPMVDTIDQNGLFADIDGLADQIKTMATKMPSHHDFIARYCPPKSPPITS